MTYTNHFGRWLRRQIEMQGKGLTTFAQGAGIAYPTLLMWLRQERPRIRGHLRPRICLALGVARDDLDQRLTPLKAAAA